MKEKQTFQHTHYAILDRKSRWVDDPFWDGHHEPYFIYTAFGTEVDWKEAIQKRVNNGEINFSAIIVQPAQVNINVTTTFDLKISK